MTVVNDFYDGTVELKDATTSVAAFGENLIHTDETPLVTIAERTKRYFDIADIATDWGNTSKVYKAAVPHFQQNGHNASLKIGIELAGDSDITAALTAIRAEDTDWFNLSSIKKVKADILEIAAENAGKGTQYGTSSEDADVVNGVAGNVLETLNGLGYDDTYYTYHHQSGVDEAGVSITVTSLVAVVTAVGHGLRINDPLTVSGANGADLNGNKTVVTVVDDDNFTYATTEADGADTNNGLIDYFARYKFFENGWQGRQLGKEIGTTTWDAQNIVGFEATPKTIMTEAQFVAILALNGNAYVDRLGAVMATKGRMVSGRFIENEDVLLWLDIRMAEASISAFANNEKIPFTNAGIDVQVSAIKVPLDTQIKRTGLNPLNDEVNYTINQPNALDIPIADRINGTVPDIEVIAKIGNAIHKIKVKTIVLT